ncbi:MAG: Holliday junction resolvase RuvX [Candidatus Bipolaricaulota bacterium]|nr:Holliday junction resolvase RuvX [Candidatus Bipolaricaulota bacterium]MDW8126895.1 Holliday junction resolvase RuvX [Candidatus Bipolaricaulota bacterium]
MHAIAFDIGERWVGIAQVDETGVLAVPYGTYQRRNFAEDVRALAELCKKFRAEALVIGLPLNMDGSEGGQTRKVKELAQAVAQATGLPVFYVDERWTTKEVERALREAGENLRNQRRKVDALSAVLILQAWLERRRVV